MAITLSDDEVSDHGSESDQEGNFMAFIATAVVSEIEIADENLLMGNSLVMLMIGKAPLVGVFMWEPI